MTGQAQTIGLDARPYALTRTGVERFAEQIAHGMLEADPNRRLIFFADQPLPGSVAQKLPGELVTLEPRGALAKLPVDYWLARQVGAALPAHGVDVFYSISSKLPFGPVPAVTTIHGMEWWRRPESYTRSQKIKQAAWMALTRRFAARVVCFAEATRRDVSNYCGAPMAQLRLASEAASAQFRPLPAEGLTPDPDLGAEPFLLILGTMEPRKNVAATIRAYAEFAQKAEAPPALAIVGKAAWKSEELREVVAQAGLEDKVHFLGFVEDERLVRLLNQARALLFLSLYEGFGLPILEAMACGTPVVTSTISSMPEVAGEAALLADPGDPAAMTQAIAQISTDDAMVTDLAAKGLKRATEYSWRRAGGEILQILDEAYDSAKS